MNIRSFLFRVFSPLLLIFLISYLSSFFNFRVDPSIPGPGPGSVSGNNSESEKIKDIKSIIREFRWDISENKTIITQLNLSAKDIKTEMNNFGVSLKIKHPSYIAKKGFMMTREGLTINYKTVFRNSIPFFKQLPAVVTYSADLEKNEDPATCFLKFAQNIRYKIPPKFLKGKYIMEFLPPLNCLYRNYGDCDTKSVLLANLLQGASYKEEKMAVIVLKGFGIFHAILAIKRIPLPGMLSFYIDRTGPFIPMETIGTGWMPGFSNNRVLLCLQNSQFRFVKLF